MEEIFLKGPSYFSDEPDKVFKLYSSPIEVRYKERKV